MMHRARSSKAMWLWGAVVASIVAMQWLAFVHRIAHNPGLATAHVMPYTKLGAAAKHGHSERSDQSSHGGHVLSTDSNSVALHPPGSWLDGLFTHQEGDMTCNLHDALANMDGAVVLKTAVYLPSPAILLVAFSQIMSTARAAALFEARGPPALS